jgi:hypothetical protein
MMTGIKKILWYGEPPQPGLRLKLDTRGFELIEEPDSVSIVNGLLANTKVVVLSHTNASIDLELRGYQHLPKFIDHGVLVLVIVPRLEDFDRVRKTHLAKVSNSFPWSDNEAVLFLTDLASNNFDNIVSAPTLAKWNDCQIVEVGLSEPLGEERLLLVRRAFGQAQEVRIRALTSGYTDSRVYMAYEKRRESSIAHWTQPKLIKVGSRADMAEEVGHMRAVSPFVPFELRPNLEIHIAGFRKSILVADFVDRSEALIDAARAGRAETAISNLFNRTLHTWRERAWSCGMSQESLAVAAENLGMVTPEKVCAEYLESPQIQSKGIDINALWCSLKRITFSHRTASIHADLHGDNVRVRGDDAILIDLGSVKGRGEPGKGAPLSFDVAMLEVALVFSCEKEESKNRHFQQPKWAEEVRPYYKLKAVLSTPVRESGPQADSWMFGCIQRLRAFAIYDQSDQLEYAIALSIAMLRWCKFKSQSDGDRGRRVVALEIAAELIAEIEQVWMKRGKG